MKVSILGDGLVSLTLAKTLVNEGIFVDLIYNKEAKYINRNRTIGMTKTNIFFFNKNILDISKLLWRIDKIEIFLEKFLNKKIIDFNDNNKQLFSMIKNYELYELLNNNLKKNKFFKRKKISIDKSFKKNVCDIIINCDQNNLITKKFFHNNSKKNYQSISYVSAIKHKKISQNNVACQIFTKFGPIAFLPISKFETSIVYSVKKNVTINFENEVRKFNKKYDISKINPFLCFELKSSNLRSYYYKNIIAFGDLLHKLHPLAGQGFNMTIRDLRKIFEIIEFKKNHGLVLDNSVCLEFEKSVKDKNYLFSSGIDFIYEFFNFENKLNIDTLSKTVKFLGKNKIVNNFFTKFADKGLVIRDY